MAGRSFACYNGEIHGWEASGWKLIMGGCVFVQCEHRGSHAHAQAHALSKHMRTVHSLLWTDANGLAASLCDVRFCGGGLMHVSKMYEQFIRRHGRALMGWRNLCATCRLVSAGKASHGLTYVRRDGSDSFATQPSSHCLLLAQPRSRFKGVTFSSITFPLATFFAQPSFLSSRLLCTDMPHPPWQDAANAVEPR
jgi:hypothetical protein